MSKDFDPDFWKARAAGYDKLDWASASDYMGAFLEAGRFARTDRVLDIGTGTAAVATKIAPLVNEVVGIDLSPEMLEYGRRKQKGHDNIRLEIGDVRELPFADASFDKVTARMVFHHVLEDIEKGIENCHRVLKPGGIFVLSEGVPPQAFLKDWYTEMFSYKEERRTFLAEDLDALIRHGNFSKVETNVFIERRASIGNWLKNGSVSDENREKIIQMHLDLDEAGRRAYNMQLVDGDIFIDMKFIIIAAYR